MNSVATFAVILSLLAASQGENKKRGVYGESIGFDSGISLPSGITYQQSIGSSGVLLTPSGQIVSDAYGLPSSGLVYGNAGYGYGRGYGYGYDNLIGNNGVGSVVSKQVTVTNKVAVPVPQPYPVPVTKTVAVAVPQPVQVPVDRPYPVSVPEPVAVPVEKPYPVPVDRPYPVPYPVRVYRPVAVAVPKPVAVPIASTVQHTYKTLPAIPVYENDAASASFGGAYGVARNDGQVTFTRVTDGTINAGGATGLSSFASGVSSGWSSDGSVAFEGHPW